MGWTEKVIDVHLHVSPYTMLKPAVLETMQRGRDDFASIARLVDDPDALVKHLDAEGVERAALINYVAPEVMGYPPEVNEFVSRFTKEYPDRLIPVGCVNPLHCEDPRREVERLAKDLGIRMLKLHGPHMLFHYNDYHGRLGQLAAIYEAAADHAIPILFHTGTSVFPGARTAYGHPLDLDDVAIDFPKLTILMAHGGRPFWTEEAFFLLRRHPNVFLDVSGIPPKRLLEYFPRLGEIEDKAVFGSDWPGPGVPSIRGNIEAVDALPLPYRTKVKLFRDNALKLFR